MDERNLQEFISGMETELADTKIKNQQMANAISTMGGGGDDNLVKWQLDLREELERITHLLKGEQVVYDEDGNIQGYEEQKNDKLMLLNDFGVRMVMNIISFYVNKNTILSNYEEDMINAKVYDLGIDLTDLLFCRSEEIGLETSEKKKMFMILIREITDTIHSTYLRALWGGERSSLKTARFVTQNDNAMSRVMNMPGGMNQQQSKFKLFSPKTWTNRR